MKHVAAIEVQWVETYRSGGRKYKHYVAVCSCGWRSMLCRDRWLADMNLTAHGKESGTTVLIVEEELP